MIFPYRHFAMPPKSSGSLILLPALFLLAACGGEKEPPKKPAPEVGIVTLQPAVVAQETELPGRTSPYLVSDVRPQVAGIVLARLFTEGALVKEGQPLYRIDPSLYRAAVGQAQGQLVSAQANAVAARLKAERYGDLEKINAVARQDAADARAAAGQADASIVQQRAALDSAQINLRYTIVKAPISGRIGRSSVTPGALVTASQTEALATIQTLDPIYVDIQQSSTQLLALRKAIAAGGSLPNEAAVQLKLEDGSDYPETGRLEFSEVSVDPSTGAVTLRARFPNRQGLLLPGMFVRAVVSQTVRKGVFLIPSAGVVHDAKGAASVLVVGAGDKIVKRPVQEQGLRGSNWIVTGGVQAGERVVIEGSGKVQPGQQVRTVAATGAPADAAIVDANGAKSGKGGDAKAGKQGGAPGAAQ